MRLMRPAVFTNSQLHLTIPIIQKSTLKTLIYLQSKLYRNLVQDVVHEWFTSGTMARI